MIEIERLTKRFGSVPALDDLTFTVQPGHVTGFLGPNGAGKTTTLKIILGLVAPTGGQALVGGQRYDHLVRPLRQVGSLLDAGAVHPGRSAFFHLAAIVSGLPLIVFGVVALAATAMIASGRRAHEPIQAR